MAAAGMAQRKKEEGVMATRMLRVGMMRAGALAALLALTAAGPGYC